MSVDYLTGRQTVAGVPVDELNRKLAAIADTFGLEWLRLPGDHPLQILWSRPDPLATTELANFGHGVDQLALDDPSWLNGQVQKVKSLDSGQSAGAIFEILGLGLFDRQTCAVKPAPESMPGFDATLLLPDGGRVLLSLKNHGVSRHETEFRRNAKVLDDQIHQQLHDMRVNGIEVQVDSPEHLDAAYFDKISGDVTERVADVRNPNAQPGPYSPYGIWFRSLELAYGPLSSTNLSTGCRVTCPPHKNEQRNFIDAIRKGCENLYKHTQSETGDFCRMILLRLSITASMDMCRDWAAWYFENFSHDPVDVILLYQAVVTTDMEAETHTTTHNLELITAPRFDAWRLRSGEGPPRMLPGMKVFASNATSRQPRRLLKGDEKDFSGWYIYHRVDAFRKVEIGTDATLETPAPGVRVHAAFESEGIPLGVIEAGTSARQALLLLP